MREFDPNRLLALKPSCPSEAKLDCFYLKKLSSREMAFIQGHVEECNLCQQRLELRRQEFDAFEGLDATKIGHRIEQSLSEAELSRAARVLEKMEKKEPIQSNTTYTRRWVALGTVLGTAMAAGLVVLFWIVPGQKPDPLSKFNGIESKGGLQLSIFRERAGKVNLVLGGDDFFPGDRLRFRISLPFAGHVMIIGVEQITFNMEMLIG